MNYQWLREGALSEKLKLSRGQLPELESWCGLYANWGSNAQQDTHTHTHTFSNFSIFMSLWCVFCFHNCTWPVCVSIFSALHAEGLWRRISGEGLSVLVPRGELHLQWENNHQTRSVFTCSPSRQLAVFTLVTRGHFFDASVKI